MRLRIGDEYLESVVASYFLCFCVSLSTSIIQSVGFCSSEKHKKIVIAALGTGRLSTLCQAASRSLSPFLHGCSPEGFSPQHGGLPAPAASAPTHSQMSDPPGTRTRTRARARAPGPRAPPASPPRPHPPRPQVRSPNPKGSRPSESLSPSSYRLQAAVLPATAPSPPGGAVQVSRDPSSPQKSLRVWARPGTRGAEARPGGGPRWLCPCGGALGRPGLEPVGGSEPAPRSS